MGRHWSFLSALDITRGGGPFVDRLRIVETPYFSVFLHHIHRPDTDPDPHDHPWWFGSLVLCGDYTEQFWPDKTRPSRQRTREHRRFSWHRVPRQAAHMITGISDPVWTLVITGPDRGGWGFWRFGEFIPWREYVGEAKAAEFDRRKAQGRGRT